MQASIPWLFMLQINTSEKDLYLYFLYEAVFVKSQSVPET